MALYKYHKGKKDCLFVCSLEKNNNLVKYIVQLKNIKKKIRRDEFLELKKEKNLKTIIFKNKKKYKRLKNGYINN